MNTNPAVLGIYLNDHLGGATMGVELFRRASGSAQGSVKTQLQELTTQVERDRESLLTIMRTLGVPVRRYKVLGGWVLEKAAWIKANGRVLGRSPLSDLIELEGLVLGVQGKAAGFRALRRLADTDPRLDVSRGGRRPAQLRLPGEISVGSACATGGDTAADSWWVAKGRAPRMLSGCRGGVRAQCRGVVFSIPGATIRRTVVYRRQGMPSSLVCSRRSPVSQSPDTINATQQPGSA